MGSARVDSPLSGATFAADLPLLARLHLGGHPRLVVTNAAVGRRCLWIDHSSNPASDPAQVRACRRPARRQGFRGLVRRE
jgi:hypothetical protein